MNLKNSIQDTEQNIEFKYIVDNYNKFQNNSNVIDVFTIHEQPYCIRLIRVKEYDWGVPQLENWEEQDWEIDYSYQQPYNTLEEARNFVRIMKRLNG